VLAFNLPGDGECWSRERDYREEKSPEGLNPRKVQVNLAQDLAEAWLREFEIADAKGSVQAGIICTIDVADHLTVGTVRQAVQIFGQLKAGVYAEMIVRSSWPPRVRFSRK